jgi:hypothetical protein
MNAGHFPTWHGSAINFSGGICSPKTTKDAFGFQHNLVKLNLIMFPQDRLLNIFAGALLCSFLYAVCLVIYRLFLSPLAKFPGPKIAAATHYYEFYYNFWLQGKYIYNIEEMHKKCGTH